MKSLSICTLVLIIYFSVLPIIAGYSQTPDKGENQLIDDDAMSVLMKMAVNISSLKKFKVKIKSGYDAVQDDGQKIEFDSLREIQYQRPKMCRYDISELDGDVKGFNFDGKEIIAFDVSQKIYATAPKVGTCDEATHYFKEELDMPLALSELFSSNLPEKLVQKVTEGLLVEEGKLGDDPVSHVAFRTDQIDFQFWINTKNNLPKKLIITYKNSAGQPQFWAYFKDWDLSPRFKDSTFVYVPPKDFEKIPFSPVKIMEYREENNDVKK